MAVKVKSVRTQVLGFAALERSIVNDFGKLSREALRTIAEFIIKDIKDVIQGKKRRFTDPDGDGLSELNKVNLSQSYRDYRSGTRHFRRIDGRVVPLNGPDPKLVLSDRTSPNQKLSNLTLTGELMDGLTYVIDGNNGVIRIFYSGYHSRANMSRDDLVSILTEGNDRNALGVTRQMRDRIMNSLFQAIRRQSRRRSSS